MGKNLYNCIMVEYMVTPQITSLQRSIENTDLYFGEEGEGQNDYGIEKETHITLLYGILPEVSVYEVNKFLMPISNYSAICSNISLFENEKFDVLKFDVISDGLKITNSALRNEIKYENNYPDYIPHLTIAYLKPGCGKEYLRKFKQFSIRPVGFMYSTTNGMKLRFKDSGLNKKLFL